jgi:hypothetical protein
MLIGIRSFQSPKKATIKQEPAGEPPKSQFARLVDELGVALIPSYSPQARGRVERLLGTLQDRLAKELRRAGADTFDETNLVLETFLPKFNVHFGQTRRKLKTFVPPMKGRCFRSSILSQQASCRCETYNVSPV